MSAPLDRPHVFTPGTGGRPLLLLHGTGGDEHDLLGLGQTLSPTGALLSVRGAVLEGTLPRFFRRLAEGVFDEDDLRFRAAELGEFVEAASAAYGIAGTDLVAVGFSNGANIASALLAARPDLLQGAVLFGAMPPYAEGFVGADLTDRWAIISNGDADPIATPAHTRLLTDHLRTTGATVELLPHRGGHQIAPALLPAIARSLEPGEG